MTPLQFEAAVGERFRRDGWTVQTTARSGDEGVDLILSRAGVTTIVQCKRWTKTVGQPIVRDLFGALQHQQAQAAYLITTGTISAPAYEWAEGKPIILIGANTVVVWMTEGEEQSQALGVPTPLNIFHGHRKPLRCVSWSPDGTMLASGGFDRSVRLWSVIDSRRYSPFVGHTGDVVRIAWSADADSVASVGADNTVRLWNVPTGQLRHILRAQDSWTDVVFSDDGQHLKGADGKLHFMTWDTQTGELVQSSFNSKNAFATYIHWSPDKQNIIAHIIGEGPPFIEKGHPYVIMKASDRTIVLNVHNESKTLGDIRFSSNGAFLIGSIILENTVMIWDANTGLVLQRLSIPNAIAFAFHTDTRYLAVACSDGTVDIWDWQHGHLLKRWQAHENAIGCIAYSPDGKLLATGSADTIVKVWTLS